ncbi:hypothetical protein E2562_001118 [Oryza meyeriana var. granulata]|uniref:Uncharacterized protein n=1 Tax=Oryza meyeriana var. granulata TaxID=110450 RepID=A0A6G1EDR7_9ORYZ|nr:hypothetical protein E2562_001118 [Oryza meyeriana var. granulata]
MRVSYLNHGADDVDLATQMSHSWRMVVFTSFASFLSGDVKATRMAKGTEASAGPMVLPDPTTSMFGGHRRWIPSCPSSGSPLSPPLMERLILPSCDPDMG